MAFNLEAASAGSEKHFVSHNIVTNNQMKSTYNTRRVYDLGYLGCSAVRI